MSNGLTIAAVTAIFKNILEDGLALNATLSSLGNVSVTTSPPDQISVSVDGQPQLNLFLYQISENRNADWIGRDRDHPAHQQAKTLNATHASLAINLHYILTAYGGKDFQTELLLGYAMELMQQNPTIAQREIQTALNHIATINRAGLLSQAIAASSVTTLAEQLGQIHIAPNLFDTEQMSRLWSLLHSAYRPSIAYTVSMVFVGSQNPPLTAKTTLRDLLHPHIERVVAAPSNPGEIIGGSRLIIYGKHLSGSVTQLCLNGNRTLVEPEIVEENRILFQLPQDSDEGLQKIQVIHQQRYKLQNNVSELVSNEGSFIVHPTPQ
jgi:Pvc16 N-terminal domain